MTFIGFMWIVAIVLGTVGIGSGLLAIWLSKDL